MIVDENGLAAFRREQLSPQALLALIERHVWVLIKLGVGVGKSVAVDALLAFPALFRRFDLVIYVAPMWNIIHERAVITGAAPTPVPHLVIKPRPRALCGPLARRWSALESRGCSALAKEVLCETCTACDEEGRPCHWPRQLQDIEGIGLVFATEAQLLQNRSLLPLLRARTGASNVLLIMDEGKLLDAHFEVEIQRSQLSIFREVLLRITEGGASLTRVTAPWLAWAELLLDDPAGALARAAPRLGASFLVRAADVQRIGTERFGDQFRYLGYELMQLRWSRREERSVDHRGDIRFTARPYVKAHMLVLSAHLDGDYVAHRLGEERIASPLGDVVVRHTGTRIVNLQSRIGADRYFQSNRKQILDTIAVLIRRNIEAGRTTLLISRKKSKATAAELLSERLARWGLSVRFVTDGTPPPTPADPRIIPFLHYGVLGVNDYTEYESAYCVNGYYLSSRVLAKRVQEFDPRANFVDLRICAGASRERRVEIAEPGAADLGRSTLGRLYLGRLERDPVVQAAGRVRFLTRPREVVFFQMADLTPEVGPCVNVASLDALRRELGIPSAKEIDHAREATGLRARMDRGMSVEDAAAEVGISRATAFRRLSASLNSPKRIVVVSGREAETPGGGT